VALVEESERAGGRMTYDQGLLEIMTPSMPHEIAGSLLGRMIERYTEIRDIEIRTVASTTFRRRDLKRGFEADESYYIQHAADIRGLREIDLSIHPPPDLVIEIELTRSSIDKLTLFASMGIPEVWRYDGQSLWMGTRQHEGYQEITESRVLVGFPVALARELLALQLQSSETELIRRFVNSIEQEDA
jgi:Uma2 family endonuclease